MVWALLVIGAVKTSLWISCVVLAAFGIVAGCGGRSPIDPGDGDSQAGNGGSGGASGGHSGSAGAVGTQCTTLGESTCKTRPDCTAQYCSVCPNQTTFAGCAAPGAPPVECPAEECFEESCSSLDEASCKTRSDCQPNYCPGCTGQRFVGCGAPGGGTACPADDCAPPPCDGLDESTCKTRSDCTPGYCANPCTGGQAYVGCSAPNEGAFACPAGCGEPPCSGIVTAAVCDERSDCHSVFTESMTCNCTAAGCCSQFSRCDDGAKASCKGPALCNIAGPYCDGTAFVVSYANSCFEGCVRPTECGP